MSKFPTQTARTGLRQILRNFKLRRSASWSACSHYISASTNLYLDNRKQNRIHLSLSLCLSVSLSLSLCLSRSLARFFSLTLSLFLCLSLCLSLAHSLARFFSFMSMYAFRFTGTDVILLTYICPFLQVLCGYVVLLIVAISFCPLIFCRLEKSFKTQ